MKTGTKKQPSLQARSETYLLSLGATRLLRDSALLHAPVFLLETVNGPLRIAVFRAWIAMRFQNPAQVTNLPAGSFNEFSGKWNIHEDTDDQCYAELVRRLQGIVRPNS
jgi:hypothetical protein